MPQDPEWGLCCLSERAKHHPVAFYSKKLSFAEDIGNRELIAVKVVLEEWHHWLKGSVHPFTIFIDHKNLEYVKIA